MPTNERAIKGEKNKKTTDDAIPGKEKARDRQKTSLAPKQPEPGKPASVAGGGSNRDEPKAEKQRRTENDQKDKGKEKPKKKTEEKKSNR